MACPQPGWSPEPSRGARPGRRRYCSARSSPRPGGVLDGSGPLAGGMVPERFRGPSGAGVYPAGWGWSRDGPGDRPTGGATRPTPPGWADPSQGGEPDLDRSVGCRGDDQGDRSSGGARIRKYIPTMPTGRGTSRASSSRTPGPQTGLAPDGASTGLSCMTTRVL